ncbi:MAG TPA: hypothetical protein VFQ39_05680 [Longimicrobium sp.]|nr:hypothetical protein [Longimicrobium sp.]
MAEAAASEDAVACWIAGLAPGASEDGAGGKPCCAIAPSVPAANAVVPGSVGEAASRAPDDSIAAAGSTVAASSGCTVDTARWIGSTAVAGPGTALVGTASSPASIRCGRTASEGGAEIGSAVPMPRGPPCWDGSSAGESGFRSPPERIG